MGSALTPARLGQRAALAAPAAGGAADRTANATEEIAKNTKKLLNDAQRGRLTFA